MTDSSYTAICLVVDRSGSIQSILEDAQGAVDSFLAKQKEKTDRVSVRLVQFDDSYEVVYPSTDALALPGYKIVPRGMTALRDAFGRGITEFGEELSTLSEDQRPGTVVFAVMTDGLENASREWDPDRLAALIKQQEEQYGWAVVYLGANQDAVAEGVKLGVRAGASLTYGTDAQSLRNTSESLDSYVVAVASAAPSERGSVSFSDEDRKRSKVR